MEIVVNLCALKLLYPSNVFIARGNHEDTAMASEYGAFQEFTKKFVYYYSTFA